MELNLETKQQLENLLAKPETVSQADAAMLGNLAKKFPYYQPLHLLLASASLNQENQIKYSSDGQFQNCSTALTQLSLGTHCQQSSFQTT
jgi:hypothetical protein